MSLPLDDAARLYDTLRCFLEAAVHLLLFHRALYPSRAFAAVAAFGLPVQQCRHPAVCTWVREAVGAAVDALTTTDDPTTTTSDDHPAADIGRLPGPGRRVDAIAFVVHAPLEATTAKNLLPPPGAVLERWVFDVRHLPRGVPGGPDALRQATRAGARTADPKGKKPQQQQQQQRDGGMRSDDPNDLDNDDNRYDYYDEQDELAQAESEAELDDFLGEPGDDNDNGRSGAGAGPAMNWTDLQQQLRGVLSRLGQAAAGLDPLPDKSSFTLALQLDDAAGDGGGFGPGQPVAWIPHAHPGAPAIPSTTTTTTTIRTVDAPPLFFECWVERESPRDEGSSSDAAGTSRPGRGCKTVSFG